MKTYADWFEKAEQKIDVADYVDPWRFERAVAEFVEYVIAAYWDDPETEDDADDLVLTDEQYTEIENWVDNEMREELRNQIEWADERRGRQSYWASTRGV